MKRLIVSVEYLTWAKEEEIMRMHSHNLSVFLLAIILAFSGPAALFHMGLPEPVDDEPLLVADAGLDQVVDEGQPVTLNGTGSFAVQGEVEFYRWDMDTSVDSDGDGDPANDADVMGPNPTVVYGDDGTYTASLTVGTTVEGESETSIPQDVVFLVDSSGSMAWNDPTEKRVDAIRAYVTEMVEEDRGATVAFGEYRGKPKEIPIPFCIFGAWLVNSHHLTPADASGKDQLDQDAEDAAFARGGTNIEKALQVAHTELVKGYKPKPTQLQDCSPTFPTPKGNGYADHVWVEILLTDGQPSHTLDATDGEVQAAIDAGIKIFTIGLGTSVDAAYLTSIAEATGGSYYPAPDAASLVEIYETISERVKEITSGQVTDSDSVVIEVRNVNPDVTIDAVAPAGEGLPMTFSASVRDPGSDDLTLTWTFDDGGSPVVVTSLNDPGVGADPFPSPEVNPRDLEDNQTRTYGDDGAYAVALRVEDDDGGIASYRLQADVLNLPPTVSLSLPSSVDEGFPVTATAVGTDPGSDDLTFTWEWEEGTTFTSVHYNDGVKPDLDKSPGG
ncbi:MAG: PKD domain-containing protein, partial [Dehalococcoidia bacterium]